MAFDVQPGQPFQTWITIRDAFGSPVTSGVTGTMTLFGPASTTALSGPSAMAHLGGGEWGVTWAGSLLTARGTHRWVTSAITGTATLAAQRGTFEVGVGDEWTLRELLTAVRRGLRDGFTGTTTGNGSATSLVCNRYAYGSDNAWKSSELFLFEPQNVLDLNPVRVTSFVASTGTFNFTGQSITSTVTGLDFILGNKDGMRWSHDEVMDAIVTAIRRARTMRRVWDQVSIVANSLNAYEYALPDGWVDVDEVSFLPTPGISTTAWVPIAPVYWRVPDNRNVLAFSRVPWNCPVRIGGWAVPALPEAMNQLVHADGAGVRDDAIYELLLGSDRPADQARAATMAGGVQRARVGAAMGRL